MAKDILKDFEMPKEELDREVQEALAEIDGDIDELYQYSIKDFQAETILPGTIVNITPSEVVVDVGYKSEGVIAIEEFEHIENLKPGDVIEVYLEEIETDGGSFKISKRRADRIRGWENIISTHAEGDTVRGKVIRKIKGGLLVDIGVPVFLPASQVSIRRTCDIGEYKDQEIECKIIKIDKERMNIVVSRRKLLEEKRAKQKEILLRELAEGDLIRGIVKNIADFGAFVDLGGIDGLLHITDMSWSRITHPSQVVQINDEIEVVVLKIDRDNERIALGLKQKTESPWKTVEEKYPRGMKVTGEVVNITNYGAFVKLEEGIEGLVHISEMSWTKRINHPSEVVAGGDKVEVVVLDINPEKQEISLGLKQAGTNPWELVKEKYPEGSIIKGRVRHITNYGAFVELEEGIDGLLHISDISWTRRLTHPNEALKVGDDVTAKILTVEPDKKRIALGIKQLDEDPWLTSIPSRYSKGTKVKGVVAKTTNFGVFIELEDSLEGLLHISELSPKKVVDPATIVKPGEEIEAVVIKVDPTERKIGLSLRKLGEEPEIAVASAEKKSPAQAKAKPAPVELEKSDLRLQMEAAVEKAKQREQDGPGAEPEAVDMPEPGKDEEPAPETDAEPPAEAEPEAAKTPEPAKDEEPAPETDAEPPAETEPEAVDTPEPAKDEEPAPETDAEPPAETEPEAVDTPEPVKDEEPAPEADAEPPASDETEETREEPAT